LVAEKPANTPAATLRETLATMRWERIAGDFALIGFDAEPADEDLALARLQPAQIVREGDETTLLVRVEAAEAVLRRHPKARVERPLAWIRFRAPMQWELVGFLAHVSSALASEGVPIGAVCGFSRDHLFVHRRHLERAESALARMFPRVA
jgi:hypothetical protein